MASTIQRLETKTGIVYSMGNHWPGTYSVDQNGQIVAEGNPADQLKVGPIFFVPGEEEPIYDTDEETKEEVVVGAEKTPPYFELWCVTDRKLGVFIAHMKNQSVPEEELSAIQNSGPSITRRVIYLEAISSYDEDLPIKTAFEKMTDRYADMYPDPAPQRTAPSPTASNGAQPSQQTGG